jgi:hypothetical protein
MRITNAPGNVINPHDKEIKCYNNIWHNAVILQAQDYRSAISVWLVIHLVTEYAWCFGLFVVLYYQLPCTDSRRQSCLWKMYPTARRGFWENESFSFLYIDTFMWFFCTSDYVVYSKKIVTSEEWWRISYKVRCFKSAASIIIIFFAFVLKELRLLYVTYLLIACTAKQY